jgi:hypothetical protein
MLAAAIAASLQDTPSAAQQSPQAQRPQQPPAMNGSSSSSMSQPPGTGQTPAGGRARGAWERTDARKVRGATNPAHSVSLPLLLCVCATRQRTGKGPAPTSVSLPDGSCVVRRVIPSDNSCLFTAVGYVMDHDRRRAAQLRRIIEDAVAADPGGGVWGIVRGRADGHSARTRNCSACWCPEHWQ